MLVRLFDIAVSGTLLVLTAPVFLLVALLIKLDSPGPVFFLQERVGRNWRRFRMFKFRKMFHAGHGQGPSVTARFDPRVTRVGSWLERTKLDELPQLINVLLGHMSLVGPRPEIPRFAGDPHRELWDTVLSVKPGLFGPNQITHRNESELFPEDCQDVEAFYVEHVLPEKLRVDAAYARKKSLWYDLWIILCGVWVSLAGTITRDTIRTRRWQAAYLVACLLLGELTLAAAFFLRFNWRIPDSEFDHLVYGLVLMAAARVIAFYALRVHRSLHAYFSLDDALRICASVAVGTILGIAIQMLLNIRALSRSVFTVDGVLLTVAMIGLSYVIDRTLALWQRHRRRALLSLSAYVVWSGVAGMGGAVSMLYALAFVWPYAFIEHTFHLVNILSAAFLTRFLLFPFLLRHLPRTIDFVATITQHSRHLMGHLLLVFIADITAAFFLNIRDFSRGAVIVNAVFYSLVLVVVLAVRCMWNHPARAAPEEGDADGEQSEERRILVVGDGRETGLIISAIKHAPEDGMNVVGVVTGNPDNRTRHVEGVEVVGTIRSLASLLEMKRASLVIVMLNGIELSDVRHVMRSCRKAAVDFRLVPSIMQFITGPGAAAAGRSRTAPIPELESRELEVR